MKIVFVAPPSPFTDQVASSLKKRGVSVVYTSDREVFIFPILKKLVWKFVIRRISSLRQINKRLFAENLLNICRTYKPDMVLINKGMIIKPATLDSIRSLGIKTVNWFLDNTQTPVYKEWISETLDHYDYFFSFDSSLKGDNVYYLPMGIVPEKFQLDGLAEDDNKYSSELCFIGAHSSHREEMLAEIKDLGLKIYGWKGWERSSLADLYHGSVDLKQSVKIYNNSKICVNLNTIPPVNGVNLKTFEIPASGGFQLTDYRKDLDALFHVGSELDIFSDKKELRDKVIHYLKNDQKRKEISLAGHLRTINDHTMDRRIEEIFKITGI